MCEVLGTDLPIMLAGMGGIAGPELVSAVSNAGGAGCLGAYKLNRQALEADLRATLALTDRPFGVNFIPEIVDTDFLLAQIETVLGATPSSIFISMFGMPPSGVVSALRRSGRRIAVQVGTPHDASAAASFSDVVILQGTEAGGHLLGDLPLMPLFEQCTEMDLGVPLVVSGGLASPQDVGTYLYLGAAGVQLGSAFVVATEANAHPVYVDHVIRAGSEDTVVTNNFSIGWPGRRHRVIATRTATAPRESSSFIGRTQSGARQYLVPRYGAAVPTKTTTGHIEQMVMYCGTSAANISKILPARQVIENLLRY